MIYVTTRRRFLYKCLTQQYLVEESQEFAQNLLKKCEDNSVSRFRFNLSFDSNTSDNFPSLYERTNFSMK